MKNQALKKRKINITCLDCNDNHKCGIKCTSMCCLDLHCGCTATKITSGLYRCDVCKLLVCWDSAIFQQYLKESIKWYEAFLQKHHNYLSQLEQKNLSSVPLDEQEFKIYETVEKFCSAKSNFSLNILGTIQLDTVSRRKNAYAYVEAYEEITKLRL